MSKQQIEPEKSYYEALKHSHGPLKSDERGKVKNFGRQVEVKLGFSCPELQHLRVTLENQRSKGTLQAIQHKKQEVKTKTLVATIKD